MAMTNVGFAAIAGLVGDTGSLTAFTKLELGSGTTAAAAADTALETAITTSGLAKATATISRVTTTQTNDTLQLTYTWTATGSATVAEVGALNTDGTPVLLFHQILGTSRSIVSGDDYTVTAKVQFT